MAFDQLENQFLEAAKRVGSQHAHLQRGIGQHGNHALVDDNERLGVQSEQLERMEGMEMNMKGETANVLQSGDQMIVVPNLRIQRGIVGRVEIEMRFVEAFELAEDARKTLDDGLREGERVGERKERMVPNRIEQPR